jgi:hypothetical protein
VFDILHLGDAPRTSGAGDGVAEVDHPGEVGIVGVLEFILCISFGRNLQIKLYKGNV